jgi:hypothetical protein
MYKRAIVCAISDLQDYNLRSNVDSIRRRVQASLENKEDADHHHQHQHQHTTPWNETIFLKSLKSLVHDGDVEQCTSLNCGLSPEFKKKVNSNALSLAQRRQQQATSSGTTNNGLSCPMSAGHTHVNILEEKEIPVRKTEHFKLKIVPKKIYDIQQYV